MKKCGAVVTDLWGDTRVCTRNKGHHGYHTNSRLISYGRQKYWNSNAWFNKERYCGQSFAGNSYPCERKPGHKTWHKSWVFKTYITWKEV